MLHFPVIVNCHKKTCILLVAIIYDVGVREVDSINCVLIWILNLFLSDLKAKRMLVPNTVWSAVHAAFGAWKNVSNFCMQMHIRI